jgi:hypothetical protein
MFTATYTDVFSGNLVTPAFPQYSAIALTSNLTLSWPAQFQNTNDVVSLIMVVSPDVGGRTLTLPDAREVGTGDEFTINNPTAFNFDLLDNTGGIIVTIAGPSVSDFWLDSNATQAGTWTRVPRGGGVASVTSVGAVSTSPDLVITGSPITTAGTFTFSFAGDLLALASLGASTGIAVRTAPGLWDLVSIQGTANQIVIVNGSGVLGAPTVSLSPAISGINSIALPNLSFGVAGPNIISSTNLNGPITLTPNGTGVIQLSKETDVMAGNTLKFFNPTNTFYISFRYGAATVNQDLLWPTTAALTGQVLSYNGAGVLSWASVTTFGGPSTLNALARYSNTTGSLKDSILILDDVGHATGLMSCTVGDILLGVPNSQTISTFAANEDLIVSPNGVGAFQVQGDVLVKPSSGSQRSLRLYNTAGTFYASLKSNAGIGANVSWFLPATDSAGTFVSDGAGNMSIQPATVYFPAVSTTNAVSRYSNTTGFPLKDSLFIISDAGAGTGLISCVIGSISLGVAANNTITTTGVNQDLNISPNGTGSTVVSGNLKVAPTAGAAKSIQLMNNAGTFFSGLKAPAAIGVSTTWTLPAADGAGYMVSDGAGNLSFLALATVATNIPQFTNTTGTIGASPISISAGGTLTGVTSLTIGNINLGTVANTIASTNANGNINFVPNGTGLVTSTADVSLLLAATQLKLRLYNSAGTFFTALQAGAAAANTTFTLPLAAPATPGILKCDNAGVMTIDALAAAAGPLRASAGGVVSVNSFATTANHIAKYSDTVATFADSGCFIDANNNISVGLATIGTGATQTITLGQGTAAGGAGGTILSIGNRTTGTGNVLALFGAGDGGVSGSSTLTAAINTKLSVFVNGTRYYIIASTAAG